MRIKTPLIFALPILYYLVFEEFEAVIFNWLVVICVQLYFLTKKIQKKYFTKKPVEKPKEKPYYLLPDDDIIPDSMVWIIDEDNNPVEKYLAAITYTLIKEEVEACYWLTDTFPSDLDDIKTIEDFINEEDFLRYKLRRMRFYHLDDKYSEKVKKIYQGKDLTNAIISFDTYREIFQTKEQANEAIADKLREEADKLLDKSNKLLS